MVAGIVLVALGMKKTIGHFDDPLKIETATALIGGFCMYLLAHVAFRWRNVHSINRRRLFLGIAPARPDPRWGSSYPRSRRSRSSRRSPAR